MAKDQYRKREVYDIDALSQAIDKNSRIMEPYEYSEEKMPVYGANVNLRRMIPELKDGLIPLHRRILINLYQMGIYGSKTTKSLDITSETHKTMHPHGDGPIYGGLVRLTQKWGNNITLVRGSGNFGTAYDADNYSSARYTSVSMSEFAYDCYFKDWPLKSPSTDMVVDWVPNFDESRLEPMYLPCKYPVFLMRWVRAMGIGRYCGVWGFSVTDACNIIINLVKDPDANFDIYPDDPMGCTIINGTSLKGALDRTDLSVVMRANYTINHYDGKDVIEITSTPYEVNPSTVKDAIVAAFNKGKLPEISNVGGASTDFGQNFILSVEVRKGYDPNHVMQKIYKLTQAQNTYVSKYAFVNGLQSVDYTIRIACLEWIRARRETLKRIYKSQMVVIIKRIHFLEPLIKVIESGEIDKFIKIVRSNTEEDAVKKIMDNWQLTDYQASKIIGVKISDLSKDKLPLYKSELKELKVKEKELGNITSNHKELDRIIIDQMKECIQKYGKPRKSKITQLIDTEQIPDTVHYLVFTDKYVKKLPYDDRGYKIGRIDTNDKVRKVIVAKNKDYLLVFTKDGRCTPMRVCDIGNSNTQSIGISYTQCGTKDNGFVDVVNTSEVGESTTERYIVSVTEKGMVHKSSYSDMCEKNKTFINMKLNDKDSVVGIGLSTEDDRILVYTKSGKCAIFPFDDFETTSFNTKGVQGAKLTDDELIGVSIVKMGDTHMVTLTDRGYVKKVNLINMPATKRNGRMIEISSGNGQLTDVVSLIEGDEIPMFICTTMGVFQLDHMNIRATNRLGKSERAAEMKITDYAFEVMYK